MCSVDTDGVAEMVRITKEVEVGSDVPCRKCGSKAVQVVLRKMDPYCRECFLAYVTHKFRSTLGKHKLVPAGASVVVATSGGPASTALLHLTHKGLALQSLKRLRIVPVFLHVDCSAADGAAINGVDAALQNKQSTTAPSTAEAACMAVLGLGLPCYYTTVEAALAAQPLPPVQYLQDCRVEELRQHTSSPALEAALRSLLDNTATDTARESVVRVLVRQSLARSCASLSGEAARLFVATNATAVANTVLAGVAEGRGAHVADQLSFRQIVSGVEVFRPLREVQEEELLHYLTLSGVPWNSVKHQTNTIRNCTRKFLSGLQENFPSTIPTVFRTGDKLLAYGSNSKRSSECSSLTSSRSASVASLAVTNGAEEECCGGAIRAEERSACNKTDRAHLAQDCDHCALCEAVLDTDQPLASALEATRVSQEFSLRISGDYKSCDASVQSKHERCEEVCPDGDNPVDATVTGLLEEDQRKYVSLITRNDLNAVLCYACRITLQKVTDFTCLPEDIKARACCVVEKRLAPPGIAQYML